MKPISSPLGDHIDEHASVAEAVALQRRYYAETAGRYDGMHGFAEHQRALWQIAAFVRALGGDSLLDTGCGTGLAMRYLAEQVPGLTIRGNDPSQELLDVAHEAFGIPRAQLDRADSTRLPYADESFDYVVETAVLHHVPEPARVIGEMLRVCRKAIFISDSNAYALGSLGARTAKLALSRVGALAAVNRMRRGGKDWYYTPGDGVAWSYSVYDSLEQIRAECDEVLVIPTQAEQPRAVSLPILFSPHILVAGFKEFPAPGSPARPLT